jgi:hypothetical protein
MTTRIAIQIAVIFAASGCTQKVAPAPETKDKLPTLIGQSLTVTGEFKLFGKLGPYITTSGEEIYILPSSNASQRFELLDGRQVSAAGVLRYQHYEHPIAHQPAAVPVPSPPQDHYYFSADTVRIEAIRR